MADLRYLLDHAKKQGAREAELYLMESGNWECRVYQGEIEDLRASASNGLAVRVLAGDSLGIAYTTDLRPEGCLEAVERAVANAGISSPDSLREFFTPALDTKYITLPICDEQLEQVSSEEKIRLALDMEEMAKGRDARIQKVLGTGVTTWSFKVTVLNTRGVNASYRSDGANAGANVLAASGGVMQGGHDYRFARAWKDLDPAAIVDRAVHHAVSLVGGRPVESQDAEVIFDRDVSAMIWAMLGRTLTGEEAQKGRSIFAGRVGQKVASDLVTLIDDPLRADGPGASPFDDEGVPRRTFPIIQDGVLKGFMYDVYSAKKAGVVSTGHARRSFRSPVSASPANLYMRPGSMTLDDVVASTKNGFLVMEVKGLGVGGFNVVSGDMSVGASGLWIKEGEYVGPVREVTIAGNLKQMLMEVDAVANDFKWSGAGTPSFRVKKMAVSGK
jgi:PmbA protein